MKKKREIRPGDVVGERSPKDDGVPHQQLIRGQTIREGARGRTEPRRGPTPPRRRRSRPSEK
jgi:hypothetical protein